MSCRFPCPTCKQQHPVKRGWYEPLRTFGTRAKAWEYKRNSKAVLHLSPFTWTVRTKLVRVRAFGGNAWVWVVAIYRRVPCGRKPVRDAWGGDA